MAWKTIIHYNPVSSYDVMGLYIKELGSDMTGSYSHNIGRNVSPPAFFATFSDMGTRGGGSTPYWGSTVTYTEGKDANGDPIHNMGYISYRSSRGAGGPSLLIGGERPKVDEEGMYTVNESYEATGKHTLHVAYSKDRIWVRVLPEYALVSSTVYSDVQIEGDNNSSAAMFLTGAGLYGLERGARLQFNTLGNIENAAVRNGMKLNLLSQRVGAARFMLVAKGTGVFMGVLGGYYTINQMATGQISVTKGGFDLAFGVIGFMGPIGMGVSGIYFLGDAFIPGGWQATPQHMYDQIQRNSIDGIWISPYNHFK